MILTYNLDIFSIPSKNLSYYNPKCGVELTGIGINESAKILGVYPNAIRNRIKHKSISYFQVNEYFFCIDKHIFLLKNKHNRNKRISYYHGYFEPIHYEFFSEAGIFNFVKEFSKYGLIGVEKNVIHEDILKQEIEKEKNYRYFWLISNQSYVYANNMKDNIYQVYVANKKNKDNIFKPCYRMQEKEFLEKRENFLIELKKNKNAIFY